MAVTATGRLYKPTVSGDAGVWAPAIDSNYDYVDEMINGLVSVTIADANMSLVADGTSNDQARYAGYAFAGALTAARTVTIPANQKFVWVYNGTTGGFNVVLSCGGLTVSVASGRWNFINCTGVDVQRLPAQFGDFKTDGQVFTYTGGTSFSASQPISTGLTISSGSLVQGLDSVKAATVTLPVTYAQKPIVTLTNGDNSTNVGWYPELQTTTTTTFTYSVPNGTAFGTYRINFIAVGPPA